MKEYKMVAVDKDTYDEIAKLAQATNRTIGGMVKELKDRFVKQIPVVGKVVDGAVVGNDTGWE